jgi:glycosyltransferase involved in cell wall biosynthesis
LSENKHILQLAPKTPSWGFDLYQQVETAFIDAGHQVTTVFFSGTNPAVTERYRGSVYFLGLNHKKPFWRYRAFINLFKLCRLHRFDAAITHHYKPSAIMALVERLCHIDRPLMVNHNPGNLRRKGRRLIVRYLFSRRWKFLTVSDWVRRDFLEQAKTISPDRVSTIYNCLDIDAVTRQQLTVNEARSQLELPADAFIFGNIHRLDKSKGHDYFIQAFASISEQMPDAHLAIIGGGDRQAMLEKLAEDLGISARVHLLGLVPEASRYIKAFDVFVIPSLHEGFGLGLLEGMSAAIPTLSSTGGALPEVVGDTGLQFPPGDTDALARRLLEVYSMSEEDRKKMGADAFQRLRSQFSKERYHQDFLALLE